MIFCSHQKAWTGRTTILTKSQKVPIIEFLTGNTIPQGIHGFLHSYRHPGELAQVQTQACLIAVSISDSQADARRCTICGEQEEVGYGACFGVSVWFVTIRGDNTQHPL